MAKNLTRLPIIPLDYVDKDKSINREIIIDYENKRILARNKTGTDIIDFNERSDTHIANGDIHTTKIQKDKLDSDILAIQNYITNNTTDITNINATLATKAPIASPALTGTPTTPTAATATNNTQIASTAFVQAAIKAGDADMVDGKHVDDTKDTSGFIWTAAKIKSYIDPTISGINTDIANINTVLATKAPIASPALTGVPTTPTAATATNNTQIASTSFVQAAIKAGDAHSVDGKHVDDTKDTSGFIWTAEKTKGYVDSLLASNDAMIFKGTLGTGGTITNISAPYDAGWSYKVITAGTYIGEKCEVGDLVICIKDSTVMNNNDWTVIQSNIDGAVTGSSTSVTANHVPIFDGVTGKVIKTSGKMLPAGNIVGDTSYGTSSVGGSVKSSASINKVTIETDGTMTTNIVDATKGGTGKTYISINSMLYASATNTYSEVVSSVFGRSLLNAISGTVFSNLNADMVDGKHVDDTKDTSGFIWTAAKIKSYIDPTISGINTSITSLNNSVTSINGSITTINATLATKAPIASPALTGVPTTPTAATATNNTQIASTAFVQAAIKAGDAGSVNGVVAYNGTTGRAWGYIPTVHSGGTMDIGRYLDFHRTSADGKDHTYRFDNSLDNELTGSGKFTAPELAVTNRFNLNNKAFINYNSTDETIEFIFS